MKESVRIFRFIVIGTMNALIMALVVWLMMREMLFEGDYMVANVTAYIIAQIHNFIWCKYWIFPVEKRKNNVWKQILFFCSAFGVAYTAQFLFLILLVEGLDVNEYYFPIKKDIIRGSTRVAIQAFLLWTSCIISIGD